MNKLENNKHTFAYKLGYYLGVASFLCGVICLTALLTAAAINMMFILILYFL